MKLVACLILLLTYFSTGPSLAAFPAGKNQPREVNRISALDDIVKYRSLKAIEKKGNARESGTFGIVSFACAMGAILFALLPYGFIIAVPAAILAIIFGAIGLGQKHNGFAVAGLVLGIVEIIAIAVFAIVAFVAFMRFLFTIS